MRSETVSTRLAMRAACGTTRRKTSRSFSGMCDGSCSNERSWIVTTAGHGARNGTAYVVWTRAAPVRRSRRGSVQSIRASCSGVLSSSGSIPSGTSSG